MLQKKQIDALMMPLSNYWLMFLCVIIISLSIAALFIFLGVKNHTPSLIIVGPLLAVTPAIFIRLKISLFAKKATILFSETFLEIKTLDTLNEKFIYSDIKFFSVSKINADKASRLKFIFRGGAKKRYIFFRQLDNDESILNNILLYFSSYNIGKLQEEKIQILPSFFLTKQGKLIVATTGFLISIFIIKQAIYQPKAIPFSLIFSLAIYIQIRAIQRNDRKILKKFRDES